MSKSDDLIRRADAIDAVDRVDEAHMRLKGRPMLGWCTLLDEIESIPPAEPKTGEWIEVEVFHEVYDVEGVKTWGSEMQCDQCGFRHTAIEGHMAQYNFCPNCGARMEVRKNDKR